MDLNNFDKNCIESISKDILLTYQVIPYKMDKDTLVLKSSNLDDELIFELQLLIGKKVELEFLDKQYIKRFLDDFFNNNVNALNKKLILSYNVDFLEQIINEAKILNSSDIHFEIYEDQARVRLRIDGQLVEKYVIEKENYLELVNKIKIKSKLNITEKRLPQDGRITTENFDIRVSILPTLYGEKIVLRILSQDTDNLDLRKIGLDEIEFSKFFSAIKKPNGIILISGPTGSGKTTTLYATLKELNDNIRNIVTVEDPIEYTLKGINQVQLKEDIGLNFATALKSFLRQDPDIIMLGEIRDVETANMAIRASLTGHLVLSTIHTNSALGTISRLIDMGIPEYLISETLKLSVAQRLIRKLCIHCKESYCYSISDYPKAYSLPYKPNKTYKKVGCNICHYTGYFGRTAIYEIIEINNNLDQITIQNLKKINHQNLSEKAFKLFSDGITTLEEIYPILLNT